MTTNPPTTPTGPQEPTGHHGDDTPPAGQPDNQCDQGAALLEPVAGRVVGGVPVGAVDSVDPMGSVLCGVHGRRECSKTSKRTLERCHARAVAGLDRCWSHAGVTVSEAKANGAARLEQAAVRAFVDLDAQPVTNPVESLQILAARVNSVVETLSGRVNRLSELENVTDAGTEQVRAVVGLWERMIRQSHVLLADLAKLGIEERVVRLEEARVQLVVGVIQAVSAGLLEAVAAELRDGDAGRLRAAWPQIAGPVVARELRALGGAGGG